MPPQLDPPLTFAPRGLGEIEFRSIDEVRAWATREAAAWAVWKDSRLPFPEVRSRLSEPSTALLEICNSLKNQENSEGMARARTQFSGHFERYDNGLVIAAESPDGHRIRTRFEQGQKVPAILDAAKLLGIKITVQSQMEGKGQQVPIEADSLFDSVVGVDFWERIVKEYLQATGASYGALIREMDHKTNARLERLEARSAELEKINTTLTTHNDALDRHNKTLRKIVSKSIRSAREDFFSLRRTYETFMALRAPATYWRERSRKSVYFASGSLIFFFVLIFVSSIVFLEYSFQIKKLVLDSGGKIDVAALLVASPLLLTILWFFRMIAKVFSVGLTESVDASQRSTMVTTYLALLNNINDTLSGAERLLVLQALFRPSGANDDADPLPANMIEAIVKLAQGKT